MGQIGLRMGLVCNVKPALAVEAAFELPLRAALRLVDIPRRSAGADLAGAWYIERIVSEIDLYGMYIEAFAEIDAEPFASVI